MNKYTIVYYTSNREKPEFEDKIKSKLLELAGDIPIISVSHKPIDLGKNICVGEQFPCDANLYRQILIGAKAAITEFIINAEADFLYPPEYFNFENPKEGEIYRLKNVYIYSPVHKKFYKKSYSEGAQISDREKFIEILEHRLRRSPEWSNGGDKKLKNPYPKRHEFKIIDNEIPAVSIKNPEGMRLRSTWMKEEPPVYELPYWGTFLDMP
jgi:hypothetical protein